MTITYEVCNSGPPAMASRIAGGRRHRSLKAAARVLCDIQSIVRNRYGAGCSRADIQILAREDGTLRELTAWERELSQF